MSAGAESAAGSESAGDTAKPDSAKAELAGAAIQEGAEKLVLAMVNQVRLPTGLADCAFSVVAVVQGSSADQIAWYWSLSPRTPCGLTTELAKLCCAAAAAAMQSLRASVRATC